MEESFSIVCNWQSVIKTGPLRIITQRALSALFHIREPFHRLGEALDSLIRVPVLDAVPDAVLDVAFQNHLTGLVQGRLGGIDLGKDVFAGDILVDHAVDGLNLANNLFQSAMQIF